MSDEFLLEADSFWPAPTGIEKIGIKDGILVPPQRLNNPRSLFDHEAGGHRIVTPGWVNAHAHLELSGAPDIEYNGDFVDWIYEVLHFKLDQEREDIRDAYRVGADALLESGVAHVLDHCDRTDWVLDVARDVAVDARPLKELIAFLPDQREEKLREAREFLGRARDMNMRCGLAPHAPYSAHPTLYRRARDLINEFGGTFSSHLHEIRQELEFSEHSRGRFQDLLKERTGETISSPYRERPVAQLCREGVYDKPGLGVHLNHCTESDIHWIEGHNLYPVFCPRSYDYFGHETRPFDDWIGREIPFCLGTDSIASNNGLDMLAELRTLAGWTPEADPEVILKALTIHPTRVMGEPDRGVLTWGTPADLSIFHVDGTDPLSELARGEADPAGVLINGELAETTSV